MALASCRRRAGGPRLRGERQYLTKFLPLPLPLSLTLTLTLTLTVQTSGSTAVRGVLVKKINRGGASVPVSIATFPFLHFASGHTYFTQSLQDRGAPGSMTAQTGARASASRPSPCTTFQVRARVGG